MKTLMDSNVYWLAKCDNCGWQNSSELLEGGHQIADTGDYGDVYCPHCMNPDVDDVSGPEQFNKGKVEIETKEGDPELKYIEPNWDEIIYKMGS